MFMHCRLREKFNSPHAIGCIDCTHVAIAPPPYQHPEYPEHIYVNRKGYHSMNVQLVCWPEISRCSIKFHNSFKLQLSLIFYSRFVMPI